MLRLTRVITLFLLVCALILDLIGRLAGQPTLWKLGAHTAVLVLALGGLIWLAGWFYRPRRGQLAWLLALAAAALARFLRGSAGVPPDRPLLWLNGVAVLLLVLSLWLQQRAVRRGQSRADAVLPA